MLSRLGGDALSNTASFTSLYFAPLFGPTYDVLHHLVPYFTSRAPRVKVLLLHNHGPGALRALINVCCLRYF
jgi:hypothetical protein